MVWSVIKSGSSNDARGALALESRRGDGDRGNLRARATAKWEIEDNECVVIASSCDPREGEQIQRGGGGGMWW